jgi:RNA polymerase sigma-70 factor (ECF subfamily)
LHDAFITIHRILPTFEGRSSIETWLCSVSWRIAADYHRRRRRYDSSAQLDQLSEESAPWMEVERFHASLAAIDDEQRDLLALHEIGGLSISSIAKLEGHARITIRNRLERGKEAVKRALRESSTAMHRDARYEGPSTHFSQAPGLRPRMTHVLRCGQTCFSTLDDIVLAVWRGPASAEALHVLIELMTAHVHAWPGGIRYLSVIERTSTPPTREGRSLLVRLARELGPRMKAAATIVESTDLMMLSASVINSCVFLARTPMNLRFYSSLASGLPWLARYGDTDGAKALAHIQRMRAALDRHEVKDERTAARGEIFEAAQ